ncbi:MAG: DUF5947 family protein [Myxococcales bacterium]
MNGLRALAPYARKKPPPPPRQRCELCGNAIEESHRHIVDLEARSLRCSCPGCAILFEQEGRFRRVPERILRAPPIPLGRWAALGVPVRLAFVLYNSRLARWHASYPGVAGAIESEIATGKWEELAGEYPALRDIAPDVEALLAWAPMGAPELECFVVPVDACYELAGLCRTHWRGFNGGDEVHRQMLEFFARLRARAR